MQNIKQLLSSSNANKITLWAKHHKTSAYYLYISLTLIFILSSGWSGWLLNLNTVEAYILFAIALLLLVSYKPLGLLIKQSIPKLALWRCNNIVLLAVAFFISFASGAIQKPNILPINKANAAVSIIKKANTNSLLNNGTNTTIDDDAERNGRIILAILLLLLSFLAAFFLLYIACSLACSGMVVASTLLAIIGLMLPGFGIYHLIRTSNKKYKKWQNKTKEEKSKTRAKYLLAGIFSFIASTITYFIFSKK
jgi:hypothetical protein